MIKTLHAVRTAHELRRTDRAERAALEREIAGYTCQGDRFDLEAILDRYSDEDTRGHPHDPRGAGRSDLSQTH